MSQVNSGIGTKAFSYDFTKNGALGASVYSHAGVAIKPGEAILDIKCTLAMMGNVQSASGSGTTFSVGWGSNPDPGVYFFPFFTNTIGNINISIFSLWQSPTVNVKFGDNYSLRWPIFMNTSTSLWFTSSAALTAGRINFIVTYQYAKF